ncbi:MAG: winged helix-turn-helix transcriptional regulator [Pseudomonadales bacterium]|nr:winged helix-turn-helix transcriptional regulator [Pseudomonadales bacterium]
MNILDQAGLAGLASRLRQLSDRLMSESGRIYRRAGVAFEPRWFPVFYYLSRTGPSSVTEIARGLAITHPRVHQIAVELIDANLVAAYKDSRDRRRRVLALTSFGKSQLPALEEVWRQIDEVFNTMVDPALPAMLEPVAGKYDEGGSGSR